MKLFHFTSPLHIESCKKHGLTHGVVLIGFTWEGQPMMHPCCQWLTINPNPDQSWQRHSTLPYDRTANRITIEISDDDERLISWDGYCKKYKLGLPIVKALNSFGDPENWFIYEGVIEPDAFIEIQQKNSK